MKEQIRQIVKEEVTKHLTNQNIQEGGLLEGVSESEINSLAESMQLNEGVVNNAISKIEEYQALFLERGAIQYFYFSAPNDRVYVAEYANGSFVGSFTATQHEAQGIIKDRLKEGYKAEKNQNKIKHLIRLVLNGFSKLLRSLGTLAVALGVFLLVVGIGVAGLALSGIALPPVILSAFYATSIGASVLAGIGMPMSMVPAASLTAGAAGAAIGASVAPIAVGMVVKGIGWVGIKLSSKINTQLKTQPK